MAAEKRICALEKDRDESEKKLFVVLQKLEVLKAQNVTLQKTQDDTAKRLAAFEKALQSLTIAKQDPAPSGTAQGEKSNA